MDLDGLDARSEIMGIDKIIYTFQVYVAQGKYVDIV